MLTTIRHYLANNYSTLARILVKDIIKKWDKQLENAGVDERAVFFKCIVSKITNMKFSDLTDDYNEIAITNEQKNTFDKYCHCRAGRMPVQYIIGEWEFRDLILKMRPPVFIPRPETENFVTLILQNLKEKNNVRFLEIGCGSGAICLSILKSIKIAKCIAIDRSKSAYMLTLENAKNLNLNDRIQVINHTVVEDKLLPPAIDDDEFDIIVSNPPYVKAAELAKVAPELLYEDVNALNGGRDGLDLVRIILKLATVHLKKNGTLWMELDESHPPMISNCINSDYKGIFKYKSVHKDMFNKERFVEITKC